MAPESAKTVPTTNYPGNSHKAKLKAAETLKEESKPEFEKVVSGKVIQRKKGLGRKVAETFTGDDAHSVGEYILFDVILPAAKAMISDAASQGVERLLFGETVRSRNTRSSGSTHTSYNRMYSPNREERPSGPRTMSSRARASHDFDEIVLSTRVEAEEVLDCLIDAIDKYDVVSVADLYELVGITGSFTDDKWGWSNLAGSTVSHVRAGFLLNLPRPIALD